MFNSTEKSFIEKQSWFHDYVSSGTKQIKRDLIHCIEKNDKSRAQNSCIVYGLSDVDAIVLYGKILQKLEDFGSFDNCSLVLKEEVTTP